MAGFPFQSASVGAGDDILATDHNELRTDLLQLIQDVQTAGETINGATLPVACFLKQSDGEWYACDGNDSTKVRFGGFAVTNGVDAGAITIQFMGIVGGFTGLTKGAAYYVKDDQTLGTTPGTITIFVGTAISTTEILIKGEGTLQEYIDDSISGAGHADEFIAGSDLVISADLMRQTQNNTYTKLKEIEVHRVAGVFTIKFSHEYSQSGSPTTAYARIYVNGSPVGTERSTSSAGGYTLYTENITVVQGDLVQLYAKLDDPVTNNFSNVKEFRFYAFHKDTLPEVITD